MITKFSLWALTGIVIFLSCNGGDKHSASNEKNAVMQDSALTEDTKSPINIKENKTVRATEEDGKWTDQYVVLNNTKEAEWMIRSGDIDNLGFGWDEGFTPFSGRSTAVHGYPWELDNADAPGTDRIMIPSGYKNGQCGVDGYTTTTHRPANIPASITLALTPLKNANIYSATLQLFVDDFQSYIFCSKFQAKLNNTRFIKLEKSLNALKQTGPIGKLINIELPGELLALLKSDSLQILIDDPETDAGDGFAIDFVRLLVNTKDRIYKGNIKGKIIDKASQQPITKATASIKDYGQAMTDDQGRFTIENVPAGINIVTGSAPTYASGQEQVDVIADETSEELIIALSPSEKVTYENKTMLEGDDLVLNNVQFEIGSANLTDTGRKELDKLTSFMAKNPKVEILLSGHTSTDGTTAFNKTLSENRVKTCKSYLMSKQIDEGRIEVIGYGAEKPIAPNDTEKNRSKNRRVEMKITKL